MTSRTSEVEAPIVSPRLARVAGVIDRFFPAVWIGIYLLLPASGWAPVFFESWHDQKLFAEALRGVLEEGHAAVIADNIVGPAYIAAAALVHGVTGLSPEDSLVALSRGSYALSVAGGMVLVRLLVRRLAAPPPVVSIAAQIVFLALIFSAGTWYWSDVPWTHFFAAFLVVFLYLTRFAAPAPSAFLAAGTGAVLALLALTRSFELVAIVAAWLLTAITLAVLRISRPSLVRALHLAAGACGFAVTVTTVYLVTGKRGLFFLYSGSLDRLSAAVQPEEIAETPAFSFDLVPTKLVQLFVDPCFYSLCSISDYAGGEQQLPPNLTDASGAERLWRLPLVVQLPALVLLPLCVLAIIGLVLWYARGRAEAVGRTRDLQLLVEMTLAASAMVLGYAASTLTGASHLRYGLARDFVVPATLVAIVAVALASTGLWLLLAKTRARVSPEIGFVALAMVGAAGAVGLVFVARAEGLPRMESRHLGQIVYTAECQEVDCGVSVEARTTSGQPIAIPEASTLTFGCGEDTPRFTIYARDLSKRVRVGRSCTDPRLVAAWPTVMGLPPGTFEHGAVSVANRG